jgi:putative ABC transport system permease protein
VSENVVRRFFAGQNPIGRHIKIGSADDPSPWFSIVGVVPDSKHSSLETANLFQVYRPHRQMAVNNMTLVVRSNFSTSQLLSSVRQSARQIDPNQAVQQARSMDDVLAESTSARRTAVLVLGVFSVLAIGLTFMGIFGVISYSMSQRTAELGLRMALGATSSNVFGLVLWSGLRLVALGLLVGIPAAVAMSRMLSSFLYGIGPTDITTLLTSSLLLIAISIVAGSVPAWHATRVSLMTTLRTE